MNTPSNAKLIALDAAKWKSGLDFYKAILPAIGAPEWHGTSVNALVDSMIWGNFNTVSPPYIVEIRSTKNLPAEIMQELTWAREDIIEARNEYKKKRGCDVEVDFKIVD
ncbi:MAG: hypothetical protein ABSA13_09055 [Beijerinckiaceae bacterium]